MIPAGATSCAADFVTSLDLGGIPPDVVGKMKSNLLYNLVTALASEGMNSVLTGLAARSNGSARLLGTGEPVGTEWAATANAALFAARTQDDTYVPSLMHIGGMVTPAVLALGEERDLPGDEVLVGLVAGYEIAGILGSKANASSRRGFRPAGLYGPLGVAAACSRLMGRDRERSAAALALAAAFAGGTTQTWRAGTQEWLYQSPVATRNGLLAAQLAERGVTGAPDALEGVDGFYAGYLDEAGAGDDLVTLLGHRWITRDVTYKSWPVCTFNQSPVTTLVDLLAQTGTRADDVVRIEVRMSPDEADYPGIDNKGPFGDAAGALMSVAFCLAVALTEGRVRLRDTERFGSPELMELVGAVDLVRDAELGALDARVTIETKSGTAVTGRSSPDPATHNWPHSAVLSHVRSLRSETRLSDARLERLIDVVADLEGSSARELVDACVI